MIALVGRCKPREFIVLSPVKIAAVNDNSANLSCVTVHIFCCRMCDNIRAEFKRAAVDGCGECVIDNQRNAVSVSRVGKKLNIKHFKRRV